MATIRLIRSIEHCTDVPALTLTATWLVAAHWQGMLKLQQVTAAWETMKEGSTVIYPLQSTFYSSARVVFVDRFGIRWGIMTETAE